MKVYLLLLLLFKYIASFINLTDEYEKKQYEEITGKVLSKEELDERRMVIQSGKYLNNIMNNLINLKFLSLCEINLMDLMLIEMCKSFKNMINLEELNLGGNNLTELSMNDLGEAIYNLQKLKVFSIHSIFIILIYRK